jgi:hypothetical protein
MKKRTWLFVFFIFPAFMRFTWIPRTNLKEVIGISVVRPASAFESRFGNATDSGTPPE